MVKLPLQLVHRYWIGKIVTFLLYYVQHFVALDPRHDIDIDHQLPELHILG